MGGRSTGEKHQLILQHPKLLFAVVPMGRVVLKAWPGSIYVFMFSKCLQKTNVEEWVLCCTWIKKKPRYVVEENCNLRMRSVGVIWGMQQMETILSEPSFLAFSFFSFLLPSPRIDRADFCFRRWHDLGFPLMLLPWDKANMFGFVNLA